MSNVVAMLDGLSSDRDIAYVGRPRCPAAAPDLAQLQRRRTAGAARRRRDGRSSEPAIANGRQVDVSVPVYPPRRLSRCGETAARPVIGYIEPGMSFDRSWTRMRANLIGALTVVAALLIGRRRGDAVADPAPGRADAPADARRARRRCRQARCLRAGEIERRAGPAHAHVQPHDAAARRVAGRGRDLSAHARGQGHPANQGARDRDGAGLQAGPARHPDRPAQPRRCSTSASSRSSPRRRATAIRSRACSSISIISSASTTRWVTMPATSCCRRSRSDLTSAVRESDTVARLGGDEFVLILPGLDPVHAAFEVMTVLTRVRESFLAPFRLADQTPTLTCSIGVSVYPVDATDPNGLIKQADTAMYAAKEAGRNAYRFYTADMNVARAGAAAARDRHAARADGRRVLPRLPAADRHGFGPGARRRGPAALARSGARRDRPGRVHPDRRGIGDDPGSWRAGAARRLPAAHDLAPPEHDAAPVSESLGAAIAARQLAVGGRGRAARERLGAALSRPRDHGKRHHHASGKGRRNAGEAQADGRLDHRRRLRHGLFEPVDIWRGCRSRASRSTSDFVHGLEQNRSDEAITQAIIALAHSWACASSPKASRPIAQFEFLKKHGCEEAQGYLISRPLEAPELRSWWVMQEEENRIVGRQPDMWRAQAK